MNTTDPTVEATNTVSLANEEEVKQVLLKSVLGLWDVVNDLTRLRPSRRYRYRVTIFGSARAKAGTFGYEETKRAAAALAEMGCDIITGGGPGLMQAANEGAATAPERAQSVGIRVDLPFEQEVNAFVTQAFEHRTFFTRLHQFVLASDAFIVAPGGNRHGSGNDDDLAAAPGAPSSRHSVDPRGENVGGPYRVGAQLDALCRPSFG
jgi:SLOG cluster4 family